MILITSAGYINPGLIAEYGKLPPCMLPVQNKRLFEHQIALLKKDENIVLSLPQSFKITDFDKRKLENYGVRIVYVPDKLPLGGSVVYALNVCGHYEEPIHILHGDTLFDKLPEGEDLCLVANAEDNYDWGIAGIEYGVYAGYFSFSSQSLIIQKITENGNDFIRGIEAYNEVREIKKVQASCWLDFGLVNSYYRSISKMTTQRTFNSLQANSYSIKKSSKDSKKILAEANWYVSLPQKLKHYAPAIWDYGTTEDIGFYEMEYYYLNSLANLFVFGRNPIFVWKEIIKACIDFINDIASYPAPAEEVCSIAKQNDLLYAPKTIQRLEQYAQQQSISLTHTWKINGIETPSLMDIVSETDKLISKHDERFVRLMHGDFCFSNILYDFKSKTIKVIDPRGLDLNGNYSIYGDLRYDVSKLAHSILGCYDYIIGGVFAYEEKNTYELSLKFEENEVLNAISDYFCKQKFAGFTIEELSIYPILVHLFLSMLPLHNDNPVRQKAMLANALRLYIELKNKQL